MEANRSKQRGNEDPIAYAMRIAKEKKALAEAKAKAKEDAKATESTGTASGYTGSKHPRYK
jgi:hypothetical protein